jgi:hypothetical protein
MKPQVLIHWDATGMQRTGATEGVEVVYVDERVPHDRVYRSMGSVTPELIELLASGRFKDVDDALNHIDGGGA